MLPLNDTDKKEGMLMKNYSLPSVTIPAEIVHDFVQHIGPEVLNEYNDTVRVFCMPDRIIAQIRPNHYRPFSHCNEYIGDGKFNTYEYDQYGKINSDTFPNRKDAVFVTENVSMFRDLVVTIGIENMKCPNVNITIAVYEQFIMVYVRSKHDTSIMAEIKYTGKGHVGVFCGDYMDDMVLHIDSTNADGSHTIKFNEYLKRVFNIQL